MKPERKLAVGWDKSWNGTWKDDEGNEYKVGGYSSGRHGNTINLIAPDGHTRFDCDLHICCVDNAYTWDCDFYQVS